MIRIKLQDIRRATLPLRSGNEGWIGVSPRGDEYHVVVPVDRQIARGVMACNRPTDGTPFGGYAGWLYFRCPPYEDEDVDKNVRVRETADELLSWLASHGIDASLDAGNDLPEPARGPKTGDSETGPCETRPAREPIACSRCSQRWSRIADLLRDSQVQVAGYRACLEDFTRGRYLFSHSCGNTVEVPVSWLARVRDRGRSLIGTHACPGLCYYEQSLLGCSARCEGAGYRRIAVKLRGRQRACKT